MIDWLHRYVFRGFGTIFVLCVLTFFVIAVWQFAQHQAAARSAAIPHRTVAK